MEDIGYLRENGGRYEFHFPALNLVIRGLFAEWVLESAAELIAHATKMEQEGKLVELETLCEFGEASEMDVDAQKYAVSERFEVVPQTVVSMGALDYRWVSPIGRTPGQDASMHRLQDMSLTRNDTFLKNETDVDTSGE